jgi:hypothetical protein
MRILTQFLAVSLLLVGCAASPPVSQAEKDALRKILAPTFVLTSLPKEREEDFYRLLQVFARERKDEMVTNVEFSSPNEANVGFSWSGGFHGGSVTAKKKRGMWTIGEKFYAL